PGARWPIKERADRAGGGRRTPLGIAAVRPFQNIHRYGVSDAGPAGPEHDSRVGSVWRAGPQRSHPVKGCPGSSKRIATTVAHAQTTVTAFPWDPTCKF